MSEFFNPYRHNFVRVAVAVPRVAVADPSFNAAQTIDLLRTAAQRRALVAVFPELGLSAYSCEDLFQQQALLDASLAALAQVLEASRELALIAVVGLPLRVDGLLYNCAAVLHRGKVLGVVPKTYLPNYREFYEARQFAAGDAATRASIALAGQEVPFGPRLLFGVPAQPLLSFHVELCEDLWVPVPPSSLAALAGATLLINLSASNITVGKADYRRQLVAGQSARCLAAYAYSAAGPGESTTDMAWDGHAMVCEDGQLLCETQRFADAAQLVSADIDLDRLVQERARQNSFGASVHRHRDLVSQFRRIEVDAALPDTEVLALERDIERYPYVPAEAARREERCREVYQIQVQGLATRLRATGLRRLVIGLSGGIDSTQALLVCVRAMQALQLPPTHILACLLPGFATEARTQGQARRLAEAVGCTTLEIDIRPSCLQMLLDIGHPFAHGLPVHDVAFENVQAGERTSHLFRLANLHDALVVGTSDLSELALGWCTYGVGDQMSHYAVNASVPKTLIQYLVRWMADAPSTPAALAGVLREVLATRISPELVPGTAGGQPAQSSEDVIGPYALQDFHLYHLLRFGYRPSKIAYLAWHAWREGAPGAWPPLAQARRSYDIAQIRHWLGVFLPRFIEGMQYKRSCLPNGPKVGSGGSLSPRGDWRAPSDARAAAWMQEWATIPRQGPDGSP